MLATKDRPARCLSSGGAGIDLLVRPITPEFNDFHHNRQDHRQGTFRRLDEIAAPIIRKVLNRSIMRQNQLERGGDE